ncbi:TadE family protein [Kineococcus sp. SYSU DK003]|uniref:TadE family protein n=1 Tax=Kineococcus sp. SYSU DK003 TaxID=3383124 RepID=UPI003D7E4216
MRRDTGDEGMVSLELAVLMSAVLFIAFALIQGAFWYHARTVALGAAQEALRVERYDGSRGTGAQVATDFINRLGGEDVLRAPVVSVARSPVQVTVTVTGRSVALVPGVAISVSQSAAGPVERFTTS